MNYRDLDRITVDDLRKFPFNLYTGKANVAVRTTSRSSWGYQPQEEPLHQQKRSKEDPDASQKQADV